jgi:rRNA maturation protein Nop10
MKEAIPLVHFYVPIHSDEFEKICRELGVNEILTRCGHKCCEKQPHRHSLEDFLRWIRYGEIEGFGIACDGTIKVFTTLGNSTVVNPEIYQHPTIKRAIKRLQGKIPSSKVFISQIL